MHARCLSCGADVFKKEVLLVCCEPNGSIASEALDQGVYHNEQMNRLGRMADYFVCSLAWESLNNLPFLRAVIRMIEVGRYSAVDRSNRGFSLSSPDNGAIFSNYAT